MYPLLGLDNTGQTSRFRDDMQDRCESKPFTCYLCTQEASPGLTPFTFEDESLHIILYSAAYPAFDSPSGMDALGEALGKTGFSFTKAARGQSKGANLHLVVRSRLCPERSPAQKAIHSK